MKSSALGNNISDCEVTHISSHGIWLFAQGEELFMSYEDFPWFARRHSLFFSFHSTHPIAQLIVNTVFVSFTCRYDVNRDFPVIYFIDQAVSDRA